MFHEALIGRTVESVEEIEPGSIVIRLGDTLYADGPAIYTNGVEGLIASSMIAGAVKGER